jgi:dTMP kinase
MTGIFLTLEGPDGAGKTTQQRRLAARLRGLDFDVFVTREPGGTAIGEQIRKVLLDATNKGMTPQTEMLLFAASRAQFVADMVRPALAMGKIVLSDRYVHASLAYQGHARGLGVDLVRKVNEVATGGLMPDVTLLLDVPPEVGLVRDPSKLLQAQGALELVDAPGAASSRAREASHSYIPDRFQQEDLAFHRRVREGFLLLAAEDARVRVIDATGSPDEVERRIWAAVETLVRRG